MAYLLMCINSYVYDNKQEQQSIKSGLNIKVEETPEYQWIIQKSLRSVTEKKTDMLNPKALSFIQLIQANSPLIYHVLYY